MTWSNTFLMCCSQCLRAGLKAFHPITTFKNAQHHSTITALLLLCQHTVNGATLLQGCGIFITAHAGLVFWWPTMSLTSGECEERRSRGCVTNNQAAESSFRGCTCVLGYFSAFPRWGLFDQVILKSLQEYLVDDMLPQNRAHTSHHSIFFISWITLWTVLVSLKQKNRLNLT